MTITRPMAIGGFLFGPALVVAMTTNADAQPPNSRVGQNPNTRPTISPYLNLLNRNGASTAYNYFNFVRPQKRFLADEQRVSSELNSIESNMRSLQQGQAALTGQPGLRVAPQATGRMSPTGHSATFGNTGSYFAAPLQ